MAFLGTATGQMIQTLVQEVQMVLQNSRVGILRAVRLASAPALYKVFGVDSSVAAGTVPAGKKWIIIEVDTATVTSLDEKALGIKAPADSGLPT